MFSIFHMRFMFLFLVPTGRIFNSAKLQFGQIELLNKGIDDANRIILANSIFQAFRKKCALPAIHALNKALHLIPRKSRTGIITRESIRPARFYTARVIRVDVAISEPCPGRRQYRTCTGQRWRALAKVRLNGIFWSAATARQCTSRATKWMADYCALAPPIS
jgi:hypothetical protein